MTRPHAVIRPRSSPTAVRRRRRSLYAGKRGRRRARARALRLAAPTRSSCSGFFEPVFYLVALGFGLGQLVGDATESNGEAVSYAAFIAPALLAVSAMNGAIYDSTWNVFFKMNFGKLYQGMLSTSLGPLDVALGEITLACSARRGVRGRVHDRCRLLGLNLAWTALLALPAVLLIAFGFASLGMAITSYLKTFQQMDWINFVLLPMFLFSATFYPITVYPEPAPVDGQALPLWHGVELVRGLTTGVLDWGCSSTLGYFVVMIAVGVLFTTRRLRALFLRLTPRRPRATPEACS